MKIMKVKLSDFSVRSALLRKVCTEGTLTLWIQMVWTSTGTLSHSRLWVLLCLLGIIAPYPRNMCCLSREPCMQSFCIGSSDGSSAVCTRGHGRKPDAQLSGSSITFLQSSQFGKRALWELSLAYFINPISCPFPHRSRMEVTRNYFTNIHSVRTHIPISWRFTQLPPYCLATHDTAQMLVFMGLSLAYHLHCCYWAPCTRRSQFLITRCTLMDGWVSAHPPLCAFRG